MRIAAHVLLAYFAVLVVSSVWRLGPFAEVAPDLVALFAVYLGITARARVAPAVAGAAIIGYIGDLLLATPVGLQATVAAIVCVVGHLIHRRLLVRGLALTVFFSLCTGAVAVFTALLLRAYFGLNPSSGSAIPPLFWTVLLTGAFGPFVFKLAGTFDRRFVRMSHSQMPVFD